ncbi:efflux RND transporter periplasmic adaptor subunit [Asticcacaulis solisilvae]|uniref:efflux RND transporter periplasmic adaptor subunit n=1 Tax=Asticcacaulis solisilvae TaxID=1217274 RepID=UPI003FD76E01
MADTTHNNPELRRMDRKIARPWWQGRGWLVAVSVIAVLAAGGITWISLPPPGTMTAAPGAPEIGDVVRGPFQDYVPLRSSVVPLDITYITAVASGRVAEVSAQDGDSVLASQALARLDNPDLTLEVASHETEISTRLGDTNTQLMALRTSEADHDQALADAEYALHKAQEDLQKYQRLREQGVANDANVKPRADEVAYQTARVTALKRKQADDAAFFAGQRLQIEAQAGDLRRSLAEVRHGLDGLTVRAPLAGRLTGFELKPGQAIRTGDALGEIDSEDAWKLSAEVDEFYVSRLNPGLKANASVHGQDRAVHVSKVYPQVHDGHVTVEMTFDSGMPGDLKRGEAIDMRLSLGRTSQAVLAPSGAWLTDSNGTYAFVLNARGDGADRRAISTGRRNPDYVEVLGGLRPGDRILTGSLSGYTRAQHIRFGKDKAS